MAPYIFIELKKVDFMIREGFFIYMLCHIPLILGMRVLNAKNLSPMKVLYRTTWSFYGFAFILVRLAIIVLYRTSLNYLMGIMGYAEDLSPTLDQLPSLLLLLVCFIYVQHKWKK